MGSDRRTRTKATPWVLSVIVSSATEPVSGPFELVTVRAAPLEVHVQFSSLPVVTTPLSLLSVEGARGECSQ